MKVARIAIALFFAAVATFAAAGAANADPPGMTYDSPAPGMTYDSLDMTYD